MNERKKKLYRYINTGNSKTQGNKNKIENARNDRVQFRFDVMDKNVSCFSVLV